VLGGTVLGFALQKTLLRLGDEFARRQLGPREQARVGAALYYALVDIADRLEAGELPRDEGFFEPADGAGRPRADELLEAVLQRVQREHEERKARHLGWLVSGLIFSPNIAAAQANFLVELGSRLTFHQLVLLE